MINTTSLTQFIQQVKSAELSNQKELKLSIQQARILSLTLSEILITLVQDYETLFNQLKQSQENQVIKINVDGGSL